MPGGAQARLGMLRRPKQPSSSAIFSTGRSSVGSRVANAAWTACLKFFFEKRPVLLGWPWDDANAEPVCASHVDSRDDRCCFDALTASLPLQRLGESVQPWKSLPVPPERKRGAKRLVLAR